MQKVMARFSSSAESVFVVAQAARDRSTIKPMERNLPSIPVGPILAGVACFGVCAFYLRAEGIAMVEVLAAAASAGVAGCGVFGALVYFIKPRKSP